MEGVEDFLKEPAPEKTRVIEKRRINRDRREAIIRRR